MQTRVAVIGAGALGLMAMKTLKEDGFDVTGYETRSWAGGLWKYSDDASLSAADKTVFNSSIYRSAMSDYPFPEGTDDFPTAAQLHSYLEDYCDYFELRSRIHFSTCVLNVSRDRGQWRLIVDSKEFGKREDRYDKVVVAIGTFSKPKIVDIRGLEHFTGKYLHAIDLHQPSQYRGQTVLFIGLHATAQDAVETLSDCAQKIYISHRNGVVLLPRYGPDGATFDQTQTLQVLLIMTALFAWLPNFTNWVLDRVVLSMSAKAYPTLKKSWNLSPAPSISVTPPLIADSILPHLQSGFAEPVASVRCIRKDQSVELTDGRILEDIDTILFCTGYDSYIRFLSKGLNPYHVTGEVGNLYHGTFPVHADPDVRSSIAYLGHAGIAFPGMIQFEIQAMAISQTWLGNSPLPSLQEMKKWHRGLLRWRQDMVKRQKVESTFYPVVLPFAPHLRWLNKTAGTGVFEHFGWFDSRAWSFWRSDRTFYKQCLNGVLSPTIFRLFDVGKRKALPWKTAKEMILRDNQRAQKQKLERLASKKNV
ncbi:flavin-containing monooxygenase-like protein [Tothia fuscella]|uniref:Flavin-containing monooxygenase-like protein n=1 Tax=Tothia fuscella TaxID=1048955 RepID=A0A9P4NJA3_9PEZI|nr:flavin-containing monooxygenase-like protein [Tothia fuscella]